MALGNFGACLAITLKAEGGFVNLASDPGGPTNLGITIGTLSHYLGHTATVDDVKALTVASVTPIYHALYWLPVQGDALPRGVDLMAWDTGVNSGPRRSVLLLQEAVGAVADGILGPKTLHAVMAADPLATINLYATHHEAFYRSLPTFPVFGHGWLSRLHSVAQMATDMAKAPS